MASIAQGLAIGGLLLFSLLSVAGENAREVAPASDREFSRADNEGIGERLRQRRVDGGQDVDCSALRLLQMPPRRAEGLAINTELVLVDLLAINDNERSFRADMLITELWKDPRIDLTSIRRNVLLQCSDVAENLWRPDTNFLNALETNNTAVDPPRPTRDGQFVARQRIHGQFSAPLALHQFPFDTQILKLELVRPIGNDDISQTMDVAVRPNAEFTVAGWRFLRARSDVEQLNAPGAGQQISHLIYSFEFERQPGFYLWRIVLPLTLIVAMSWSVFWIHSNQLGAQMEVSSAAVLTLIAFQMSFTDVLPAVSYLTRLDVFVLTSTVLVFLALAESVWTSWLARNEEVERAERIDRQSRYVFPAAFSVTLLYFFGGWLGIPGL
ncbi:MAG: hypothetical protein AAF525_12820 [Pseudomonadota bacterium]